MIRFLLGVIVGIITILEFERRRTIPDIDPDQVPAVKVFTQEVRD